MRQQGRDRHRHRAVETNGNVIEQPMYSYHVYFSLNQSVTRAKMETVMGSFVAEEMQDNLMTGYRLLHMKDKASSQEIPDYHFIADYASAEDGTIALKDLATRYREEPHASLMRIVSDFRVAFSDDLITPESA